MLQSFVKHAVVKFPRQYTTSALRGLRATSSVQQEGAYV